MIEKIKKNIVSAVILSSIIYLGFSLYADFDSVLNTMSNIRVDIVLFVILLTSINFFIRFLKWHYYLKLLSIDIRFSDSLLIFLSGLIMSVTPGKFGEVLKSFLLKKVSGIPISESAPIIISERITDFFSVLLLAILGAVVYGSGLWIVLITSAFFVSITLVINNRAVSFKIIGLLNKVRFLSKYTNSIKSAYESSYKMLKIKPLYEMTFLSLLAWLPECFGFYLILYNFDVPVSIFWSVFVYAFSIIIGALTLLPAGIGITEGSLTFFIFRQINSIETSVSITLLIRIFTLWYAVFIGIISLTYFNKKNKLNVIETAGEENGSQ